MTQKEANKLFTKNRVVIDLFRQAVSFFFTREDFNIALDWRGDKYNSSSSDGCAYESILVHNETKAEETVYMVGIFTRDIDTIVHECTHISIIILNNIGYEAKDKYDEIMPYMVGFLSKQAYQLMEKHYG